MSTQIQRHLKTEELYDKVLRMMFDEDITTEQIRGKLDAILSQGKIEGRLTAIDNDGVQMMQTWRSKNDTEQYVQVTDVHRGVAYRHINCTCPGVEDALHVIRSQVSLFQEEYELWSPPDRLIEDWQRIVDSA